MCPFCIGAAAWAAAGVVSAGGLGILAAVVRGERGHAGAREPSANHEHDAGAARSNDP